MRKPLAFSVRSSRVSDVVRPTFSTKTASASTA